MAATTAERLISADDHVDLTHDQVMIANILHL